VNGDKGNPEQAFWPSRTPRKILRRNQIAESRKLEETDRGGLGKTVYPVHLLTKGTKRRIGTGGGRTR